MNTAQLDVVIKSFECITNFLRNEMIHFHVGKNHSIRSVKTSNHSIITSNSAMIRYDLGSQPWR